MSKTPPKTIEELKAYIESHEDEGKLNGEQVVPTGTMEFRHGEVNGNLYDLALLRGAPFGFTKSNIATEGSIRLLSNAVIHGAEQKLIAPELMDKGTEFRAFIPSGLYNMIQDKKRELGWSNSQMMTLILVYFAHDPGVTTIYIDWVNGLAQRHGVDVKQVEATVFSHCRYQARLRRYEMSLQQGKFVSDRKIAT